jgi:hypothetical protein
MAPKSSGRGATMDSLEGSGLGSPTEPAGGLLQPPAGGQERVSRGGKLPEKPAEVGSIDRFFLHGLTWHKWLILFNVHVATLEDKVRKSARKRLFGERSLTSITKLSWTQAGSPKDCLELDLLAIADPRRAILVEIERHRNEIEKHKLLRSAA